MPANTASPAPSPALRRRQAARQRAWARRRPRLSRLLAWLLTGLWGGTAMAQVAAGALPSGGQVVVGSGQLLQSANLLVVQQNSARLGLDWQSFNIGPGATVEFRQPGASSIALNRVLGNSGSEIYGQIKANGQVFLTNPNGVLFAPGAQVDVGGLVASTLDLSQQDFAAGRYVFSATGANGSSGSVVNQGQLRAQAGGYLALFGQQVSNSGSLAVDAGTVLLASGRAATVSISGSGLISAVVTPGAQGSVLNSGSIAADGGTVTLTAKSAQDIAASLVNNTGIVRANTLVEKAGEIWITGDNVATSGQVSAAAPNGGDAGRINVLAGMQAGTAQVGGTLDASAAAGRGGFIETSGAKVKVAEGTQVTTLAPLGGTGTWLMDPTDYTIAASGGDITGAQVSGFVNSNNYIVSSSTGSIIVNDQITWSQNKLTLSAFANVNINAALTGTGTASLALEYGQGAVAAGNTAGYSVAVPVALPTGTSFSTKLGSNGSTASYNVINSLASLRALDGNTATLSANYALGADIDASATAVSGQGFDPIGNQGNTSASTSNSFSGRFDGLGHTISGLTINVNSSSVGLFASAFNADIRNLVLSGGSVSTTVNGGALAGVVDGSTRISNVSSSNTVTLTTSSTNSAGGLVGQALGTGSITGSIASGAVTAPANRGSVGGLAGIFAMSGGQTGNRVDGLVSGGANTGGLIGYYNSAAAITDGLYTAASVSGGGWVGGLVGYMNSTAAITGASPASPLMTTANVISTASAGGIAGRTNGPVSNVKATGNVSGIGNAVGGLVGEADGSGSLTNSVATGTVSGSTNSGSVGGLVGNYSMSGAQTGNRADGLVSGGFNTGGLFGFYDSPAVIAEGSYTPTSISGGTWTGGLVGYMNQAAGIVGPSSANPLTVSANVISLGTAGGVAGRSYGPVANVKSTGDVTGAGNSSVGGIVGQAVGTGAISNSTATGKVTGATNNGSVGGLVGTLQLSQGMSGDRADGVVSGGYNTGGLVGYYDSPATIVDGLYTQASISGGTWTGGLIGYMNQAAGIVGASSANPLTVAVNVTSLGNAGGVAGRSYGPVTNILTTGNVTGAGNSSVGGIVGQAVGTGAVSNSTATGKVTGSINNGSVGGLVGTLQLSQGMSGDRADGVVSGGSNTGGLVGYYDSPTAITDGLFTQSSISGGSWVGGLIGYMNQGSIIGASASSPLTVAIDVTATGNAGGLVGRSTGAVSYVKSTGKVTGGNNASVGGVIGVAGGGALLGLQSTGNVTGGSNSNIAGLVGWTQGTGRLSNSVASGTVTGPANTSSVGGLVGYYGFSGAQTGNRVDGLVSGGYNTGGLVGYYDSAAPITDGAYTPASVSGGTWVGGWIGYMAQTASISGASAANPLTVGIDVTATGNAGGLVGRSGGAVSNVKSTGKVIGVGNVGGLIGQADGSGGLTNATATGNVTGATNNGSVGGLVGAYQNSGATSGNRVDGVVTGGSNTGGLYGFYNSTAVITDGSFTQPSISGGTWVGGLVGYMNQAAGIAGASAANPLTVAVNVTALGNAGGVAGRSYGPVTNVTSTGNVTGAGNSYVGGVVGQAVGTGSISNSIATGKVTGSTNSGSVGGLVGGLSLSAGMAGDRADGLVTGGYYTGGLVGYYDSPAAITSGQYTAATVSGGTWTGGLVGYMNQGAGIIGASAANPLTVTASVTSLGSAGGVAGNSVGPLANLKATGDVTGAGGSNIGGLVGAAAGTGGMSDTLATGKVTGSNNNGSVGGLVGNYSLSGAMARNEADGAVAGGSNTGGLIGYYNSSAAITDGVVKGASVSGGSYVGGLVGYINTNAAITGTSAASPLTLSTPVTATGNAGGLVGRTGGAVSNVLATADVSGGGDVGGLIGVANGSGLITNAGANGKVTATGTGNVGGLIGNVNGTLSLSLVNASGAVSGGGETGGLLGNYSGGSGGSAGSISYATATGAVTSTATGGADVGGLVGYATGSGSLSNSSASGKVTAAAGADSVGGLAGEFRLAGGIVNSTAAGPVSGGNYTGGVVGYYNATTDLKTDPGTNQAVTYTGASVSGSSYTGGLVGYGDGTAKLVGLSATAAVSGTGNVGGLVGFANNGVSGSSATGTVTGTGNVGGLVGQAQGLVTASTASGAVSGGSSTGGLVGYLNGGTVTGSTANGSVSGSTDVGGLVGYATGSGKVADSKATGAVTATTNNGYVGGLAGDFRLAGGIVNSEADGNVSGGTYTGGLVGYYASSTSLVNDATAGSLLTVKGSTVSGTSYVGGLVGYMSGTAAITGVSVAANVTATGSAGGLAGRTGGNVSGSSASGTVTGTANVGGLVGEASGTGTISASSASGAVSGPTTAGNVGGLVGYASGGSITGSSASGAVSGGVETGGLVGYFYNYNGADIIGGLATGNVSAAGDAGGLLGFGQGSGKISGSKATGDVSTTATSSNKRAGGLAGDFQMAGGILNSEADGNVSGGNYAGGLVGNYTSAVALVNDSSTGQYITVKSGTVTGINYVGGVVGVSSGGASIVGITATANVSSGSSAGGLAGYTSGSVSKSSATGSVTGGSGSSSYVGGLVGQAAGTGTLSDLNASGTVSAGSGAYVGGLVGYYSQSGGMLRDQASGTVSGGGATGGLVGYYSSSGTLDTGKYLGTSVTGTGSVGGLVGSASTMNVTGSSSGAKVSGGSAVGGLVGTAVGSGSITSSSASGDVSGTGYVGGLAGSVQGYSITSSHASGNVSGVGDSISAGGLVGSIGYYNYYNQGFIASSQATGNVVVDARTAQVGGLVGQITYASISGSTASGNVTGLDSSNANSSSWYTGGLVGYFTGTTGSAIATSSASGAVAGRYYSGGLVGWFDSGSMTANSASGAVSGSGYVGGLAGYANASTQFTTLSATGNVTAGANASYVGGLVGQLVGSGMSGAFASGKVTATGSTGYVGGLVGYAQASQSSSTGAAINDSRATGDVSGGNNTGGLVGYYYNYYSYGGIVNSHAEGNVTGGTYAGGLVGQYSSYGSSASDIRNAYATGSVSGLQDVGGLVGFYQGPGGVSASYATGSVVGRGVNTTTYLGGLVGQYFFYDYTGSATGGLSQSYATGNVSQTASVTLSAGTSVYAGGLVGYLSAGTSNSLALADAYATGSVTVSNSNGQLRAGGLVGYANASLARGYASGATSATGGNSRTTGGLVAQRASTSVNVTNSYWDTTATGQATSQGGVGLTSAQMQQAASFTGFSLASDGSGGKTWRIYEGHTTPLLSTFLSPLTLTLSDASKTYDGTTTFGNAQIAGASGPVLHPERIFTSLLSPDVGSYAVSASTLYSVQQGYDLTVAGNATLTVTPRPLTLAGVIADKVYDGTTNATVIGSAQPTGLVAGEDLSINIGNVSAHFDTKNVGTNKTVTVSGYTLADGVHGKASNYSIGAGTNTTASITPASLTAGGFAATDRAYDGTTLVAVQATGSSSVSGVIGNDDVHVDLSAAGSGQMADKNVGSAKPVTVTGVALTGADAGNYKVTGIDSVTVNITPKPVTVNSITAADRTYNGSTAVTVNTAAGVISGLVAGDLVSVQSSTLSGNMADKNVGTAKPVTVSGVLLRGPDAANYSASTGPVTVNISPATAYLYVYRTNSTDKVYDGSTSASVGMSLSNVYGNDQLTLNNATAAYGDKNVAYGSDGLPTTKSISVSGATLGGADAANYTLNTSYYSTYGTITPRALPVTGIVATPRVYDGTTTVSVNLSNASVDTSGLIPGDSVSVNVPTGTNGNVTGTVASRNAGTGKAVSVPGLSLSGADAANYSFAGTSGVTVTITPKPVTASYVGVDKVYDGTTYAQVVASSSDLLAIDLAGGGVSFYSNNYGYGYGYAVFTGSGAKNVGTGKAISVVYDQLQGQYAGNYTLQGVGQGTASASVTPRPLSSLVYSGGTKVYDGTAGASVTLNSYYSNIIGGDAVTTTQDAVFTGDGAKNVGSNKAIAVSNIVLGGADAFNYTLTGTTASTTGSITAKPVTFSGISAVSRTYDGTTTVAVNASGVTSSGFVAGDQVSVQQPAGGLTSGTVATKDVGTNKVVTVTGLTLTGSDKDNYSIDAAGSGIKVDITAKGLTASYVGVNKVYDGGVTAQVTGSATGIIDGDSVGFSQSAIFTGLDGRNVGTAKPISITGIALTGTDRANYTLVNTTASASADVTPKPVSLAWTAASRVYDGVADRSATVQGQTSDFVAGDLVTVSQSALYRIDGSAGVGKAIDISNVALGGAQSANYALVSTTGTTTGTITQRPIGVTGIVAQNRVYDGTTTVAINVANASIDTSSIIAGDVVGVTLPPDGISSGSVATRDVGAAKPVQVTGLGLTGSSAANYTVVGATGLTVNITPRPLTATYSAASKVYDGTTLATVSAGSSDILAIDLGAVGISASGLFGDKNVAGSKAVAVSGGFLTGGARNNYSLVNATGSVTAAITPKLLTAAYVGGSKVYDGTALALVTAQTAGIVSGDDLGFTQTAAFTGSDAKNVGSGKAIAVTGIALTGADAGNYALSTNNASTTGSVTPKPITVSGLSGLTVADRVYDGTTTVAVTVPTGVTLVPNSADIVSGDQVTIGVPASGTTTGTMATKTVGTNKAVAVTGLTLDGADARNYFVAGAAGLTVNITPKSLTASYTGVTRAYDGSTSVAVTGTASGILGGDAVSIGGSGVFSGSGAKNVGSGKPITVTLASLSGSDAVNYALVNPTGSATGIVIAKVITPAYSGGSRIYDGSTTASVTASGSGIVAGDAVSFAQSASFADKNVGTGKTIAISGITISGADAANYALLTTTASTTGSITPRPITLLGLTGVTATDRVYDGTRTVAVTLTASGPVSASPGDLISGDDVQLSVPGAGTTTGTVADKNAGNLKPVTVAGLGLSGSDAGNYSIAATAGVTVNIAPKPISASYAGISKVYDGTAAASVSGSASGIYNFDSVSIAGSGVFSAGKNVGSALAIAVLNASLAGIDAGNYTLLNPTGTASASITPKPVSVAFAGGTKVYDGSTTAPVTGTVVGMVTGDSLSLSDSAVFSDGKNVGSAKPVLITGVTLGGTDAGNYALQSSTASTTASVTQRPLRIDGLTGVTATDRVYDGTTAVSVTVSASGPISPNASDLIAGDVVAVAPLVVGTTSGSMADKNVGSNKPVVVAGLTLTGTDAGNYSVAAANGVTVNITPKPLTASYTGQTKVYDATAAASVLAGSTDIVGGDSVTISASGTFTGSGAKNVGSNKAVAVSGGTLGSTDAANYTLLNPTGSTTAGITPRPVTASFIGDTKVYDGSSSASAHLGSLGILADDVVITTQTAVFSDGKNVGDAKPVLVSGIALTGTDAANYALTATTAITSGSITPRPLSITGLTGLTAVDRVYDGTLGVSVLANGVAGTATLSNVVSGDDVALAQGNGLTSGTLLDKNAGNNKPVVLSGLALTGADKGNYLLAGTAGLTVNIAPRSLTATYTGIDKIYDATATASVSATSADILAFDSLSITGTGVFIGSGAKNVGSGKAISITGATLAGTDAANYTLLNPTGSATASITPRPLTASYSGGSKVYDGTLTATVTAVTGGILGQDSVSFTQNAQFTDSRNVGSAKPVQVSDIAISGADAANYALTATTALTTASITPRPLNVTGLTGISAVNRVYDGTRSVSLVASGAGGTAAVDDKLPGDDVSVQLPGAGITTGLMLDKNVGTNKPVALAGLTLTGADAGNYTITGTAGVSVTIAPKPVVLLGLAATDRVYDGSTAVAINSTGGSFSGAIAGDDLSLPAAGLVGAIADRHVGTARPVSLSGLALAGADAANYTLTSAAPLTVNITPRTLVASATAADRLYDGSTGASLTFSDNRIAGDALTLAASASFADKNAGSGKVVTVGALSLSGADAGDYVLASTPLSASASILPRPLLVSAASQTKLYGNAFAFSGTEFTTQGLVVGETIGQVSLASAATLAGAGVSASPYAITAGLARGGSFDPANYVLAYANGTFTVQPRPLTLATNTVVRYSDEPNPTHFDFSSNGLVNGDTVASVVQAVPPGSANAPGGSVFTLLPSGAVFAAGSSAANYDLHYAAGLLVVLPKPARLTDTDVGGGNDGGAKQFVVAVDPADLARAQTEIDRTSAALAQAPFSARPAPSRATEATANEIANEIAIALAADGSRITLPALQRLPLVTMDPRLKRLIQGPETGRPASQPANPPSP